MVAKAKYYIEGCQILAEMTMRDTKKLASFEQLNQDDWKPGTNVVRPKGWGSTKAMAKALTSMKYWKDNPAKIQPTFPKKSKEQPRPRILLRYNNTLKARFTEAVLSVDL